MYIIPVQNVTKRSTWRNIQALCVQRVNHVHAPAAQASRPPRPRPRGVQLKRYDFKGVVSHPQTVSCTWVVIGRRFIACIAPNFVPLNCDGKGVRSTSQFNKHARHKLSVVANVGNCLLFNDSQVMAQAWPLFR